MIVIFHCRTISLLRGLKRVIVKQFNGALMRLPTAELSLHAHFCCPDLVGGVLEGEDDTNA